MHPSQYADLGFYNDMTKKQILLIAASFLSILILFVGISALAGIKKPSQPLLQFGPTPTPINTNITIPHTYFGSPFPPNNMNDIGTNTNISYTFFASLSAEEKNNVSIQVEPSTPGSLSWDNKTLIFSPDAPLAANQKYTVTLINGQTQNTWSFITSPVSIDPNNAPAEQQAGDVTFGKITQQNLTNYPWLNSLPIQSSQYFVYFNVQQKAFLATIYPNKNSSTSLQEQTTNIKNSILQQLSSLGIHVAQYPFVWTITPVSE